MVFCASIIIGLILYFLQGNGIIYAVIVAIVAELINLFMAQTLTKSVEKKVTAKYKKIIFSYKHKINLQKKTVKEFEKAQEESVKVLYKANKKIKEYEDKLKIKGTEAFKPGSKPTQVNTPDKTKASLPKKTAKKKIKSTQGFNDLPSGSNRKQ